MRILVHAHSYNGWHTQCLAEDARTSISEYVPVRDVPTLLKLLRYVGATEEDLREAERDIKRWGIVSIWIDLIPGRKNLLQIHERFFSEISRTT